MTEQHPSRIQTRLAVLFCVFAVLICAFSGALFSLNIILSKKNLAEIIVNYSAENGPEEVNEVYSALDSADLSSVFRLLEERSAAASLASAPLIEEMSFTGVSNDVFDSLSGYGAMFSGVASLMKIINGDYNVVGVVLDAVGASTFVTADSVSAALKSAGTDAEGGDERVAAFLRTRLAAELTAIAAHGRFDIISGSSPDGGALRDELCAAVESRKQDLLLLPGFTENELAGGNAGPFASALASEISLNVKTAPETDASNAARALLNTVLSRKMALVYLFLGCLNFAIVWLLTRSGRLALRYWGTSFIFCGFIVMALHLLRKRVIGGFFNGSGVFMLDNAFPVVGGAFILAGVVIVIAASARTGRKKEKALQSSGAQSNVLTASDIEIIQKFGLSDLVMSNEVEKKRRPDGTVDYYGDGRGLEAQREFLRKQKEREEAKKKAASDRLRGIMPDRPQDGTTLNGESVPPKDGEN